MCLAVLLLVVALSMMILSCPSGSNDVAKADKGDSIANAEQGAASSFTPNADRRTDDNITERKVETFFFDPNTADSLTFFRLGLQRWQVRNILRYRARGGVFQRKEDFGRVYGLTAGQYHRLAPYIRIAPEFRPAAELEEVQRRYYADGRQYRRYASEGDAHGRSESTGSSSHGGAGSAEAAAYDESRYGHKLSKGEHISINVSDTTALKRVPGIGSYFCPSGGKVARTSWWHRLHLAAPRDRELPERGAPVHPYRRQQCPSPERQPPDPAAAKAPSLH